MILIIINDSDNQTKADLKTTLDKEIISVIVLLRVGRWMRLRINFIMRYAKLLFTYSAVATEIPKPNSGSLIFKSSGVHILHYVNPFNSPKSLLSRCGNWEGVALRIRATKHKTQFAFIYSIIRLIWIEKNFVWSEHLPDVLFVFFRFWRNVLAEHK